MSEVYANAPYPDIDWGSVQQVYWSGFPVLQSNTTYSGEFTTSRNKLDASIIFTDNPNFTPTLNDIFTALSYNRNTFGGILAFIEDVDDEGNIAVFANREDIVLPTEIGGSVSGELELVPTSEEQQSPYSNIH